MNKPKWEQIETTIHYKTFLNKEDGLIALRSRSTMKDGSMWIHVSVSHHCRVPNYKELCEAKEFFMGEDREAMMLFAKKSQHVNIHPTCLHLWAPLTPIKKLANLMDLINEEAL